MSGSSIPASWTFVPVSLVPTESGEAAVGARRPEHRPFLDHRPVLDRGRIADRLERPAVIARVVAQLVAVGEGLQVGRARGIGADLVEEPEGARRPDQGGERERDDEQGQLSAIRSVHARTTEDAGLRHAGAFQRWITR